MNPSLHQNKKSTTATKLPSIQELFPLGSSVQIRTGPSGEKNRTGNGIVVGYTTTGCYVSSSAYSEDTRLLKRKAGVSMDGEFIGFGDLKRV